MTAELEIAKKLVSPELAGISEIKPLLNPVVVRKVKAYSWPMLEGSLHTTG